MKPRTALPLAAALFFALGGCERTPDSPSTMPSSAPATPMRPAASPIAPDPVVALPAPAPSAERRAPHFVETPAEAGLLDAIRGEARAAESAGETLVVYVGARWCKPCQHFEGALASGKLDERLAGLRLLHVDLDARGAELATHGYATKVIPYFVVPTPKGTPSSRTFSTGAMDVGVVDQIVAGLAPFRPRRLPGGSFGGARRAGLARRR